MLSDINPVRELARFVRQPHFGRYAILLVHLLLLPLLSVVTEGHPKAELVAMVAEQVVFLGAVVALGGRRMFALAGPLVLPGILTLAVTFAVGEIPGEHYWFWAVARAVSFIVPIITVGLLILVDVLAAKQIVFDMICGALCVFVLFGMCWANVYTLLERLAPGSFAVDFGRYHVDAGDDPLAAADVFIYYSFVTLTTVGYGDIVPSSATARWLVWLEAVFGQFYMAVFVSRLIGLQASPAATDDASDPAPEAVGGPEPVPEADARPAWATRRAA
ncbi:MAG: potassium channel family protein [Planctomycetota bacterium]